MAKRRKSVASRLDEVDRTIYSSFCSAANSLSQIYTQAMNQQKIAFQAGERHGVEKVQSWVSRRLEEGLTPTIVDLLGFLQNELEHGGDESLGGPHLGGGGSLLATHQGSTACSKLTAPPCLVAELGLFTGGGASPFAAGDTAMDTHSDAHQRY